MRTSVKLKESFKILSAAFIAFAFYKRDFNFLSSDITTLASAVASSSGTILGFLITAIALLAAIMDRDLMRNLRATGGYKVLIVRSFVCAALYLILLVLSLCLLLPWGVESKSLLLAIVFIGALASIHLFLTGISFCRIIVTISKL